MKTTIEKLTAAKIKKINLKSQIEALDAQERLDKTLCVVAAFILVGACLL